MRAPKFEYLELARPIDACVDLRDALVLFLPANLRGSPRLKNRCEWFATGTKIRVVEVNREMRIMNPRFAAKCLRTKAQDFNQPGDECLWSIVPF